jgi:hypothetical protein
VYVLTVGQQKRRCVGAWLGRNIGVESRVMHYIGEHDIAATCEGVPSDRATNGPTSHICLAQEDASLTYHGDRVALSSQ